MSSNLPNARVVPKDAADHRAILQARVVDGGRKVGRATISITKSLSLIALCGVGVAAIGAGFGAKSSRSRALDDLDRQMKTLRQINLQPMPKIDWAEYQRLLEYKPVDYQLRLQRMTDLSSGLQHEAVRATSSP